MTRPYIRGPLTPDDPRHGTNNGYSNFGCRCDPCKAARVAYNEAWGFAEYTRRRRAEYAARGLNAKGQPNKNLLLAARRAATDERIRAAVVELVGAGEVPSMASIARLAGVSRQLVSQRFGSLPGVLRVAGYQLAVVPLRDSAEQVAS